MLTRDDVVLAAMAPAEGRPHTPVQLQKLLFLIDENISGVLGGRKFDFIPYAYGPFDRAIYDVLKSLRNSGFALEVPNHTWTDWSLTVEGQRRGHEALQSLPSRAREYIKEASMFVRKLSFSELVAAIYRAYPQMRVNSVFQG